MGKKRGSFIGRLERAPLGVFAPDVGATLSGKPYKGEALVMIPESKWEALLAEIKAELRAATPVTQPLVHRPRKK